MMGYNAYHRRKEEILKNDTYLWNPKGRKKKEGFSLSHLQLNQCQHIMSDSQMESVVRNMYTPELVKAKSEQKQYCPLCRKEHNSSFH